MEVLAISVMIGSLGLLVREMAVVRQDKKAAAKQAKANAEFKAELFRTNVAFVASCKK